MSYPTTSTSASYVDYALKLSDSVVGDAQLIIRTGCEVVRRGISKVLYQPATRTRGPGACTPSFALWCVRVCVCVWVCVCVTSPKYRWHLEGKHSEAGDMALFSLAMPTKLWD